jgi:hypothetical protein
MAGTQIQQQQLYDESLNHTSIYDSDFRHTINPTYVDDFNIYAKYTQSRAELHMPLIFLYRSLSLSHTHVRTSMHKHMYTHF